MAKRRVLYNAPPIASGTVASQLHTDRLSGQMLGARVADTLGWAVGKPDTDSGEACRGVALGATSPTDRPPLGSLQHRLRSDRLRIGDMPLAGATASGNGEDHRHVGGIDLLLERDADCPGKAARRECLPEGCAPYPASASTQPKRMPAARTRLALPPSSRATSLNGPEISWRIEPEWGPKRRLR